MRKLILLVLMASAAFAQTAINDTIYLQSAAPWTGQITVSWPAFVNCAGTAIAKGSRVYAVNAGVVSITLYATDCASPSIAYAAAYRTMGGAEHGKSWSETWTVPSSPSIVTLAAVRQTSTLTARPLAHASTHASAGSDPVTPAAIGLGNVNNTSDANKPVSTAQQAALDAKAPINNPVFTSTVAIGGTLPAPAGASAGSLIVGNPLPGKTGTIIDPAAPPASAHSPASVWTDRRVAISPTLPGEETGTQEPTVLYESGCQILSSPCFKMWYSGGVSAQGIYYAESADGSTWTKRSTPVLAAGRGSFMLHSGATYYLYICVGTTQIDLHTSSNGVDFTLDTAAVIARGAGGTWDASAIGNLAVIVDGATWRMAYEAHGVGAGWEVGTATSANGRTWTKNPSNPVMGNSAAGTGFGGPALFKIGSTYWCWGHVNGTLPTDGGRFSSPDFVTWTRSPNETSLLTFGAVPAAGHLTLPRLETDEGAGLNTGQVADLSLVEVSGRTYIFYTASPDGVTNFKIKRAVANLTMAQLVTTDETPAVTPGSVIIAPLANTDQIEVTQADRKTVLFDIDPATGTQTIYARTAGGQGPAKLVLRSFKNAEASATDAAITCNWWASGCILTLPRDVGGHGYHLQNHAGQDILYLDSSDKKATLPGYAGTGQSFACFDAAGKLVRSDTACR